MRRDRLKRIAEDTERPDLHHIATIEVFDKLSKALAQHAAHLAGIEATREQELRGKILEGLKGYKSDRNNLGHLLASYKSFFKTRREWTAIATEIGEAISVSARTVFRIIDEYEHPGSAHQATPGGTDVGSIRGETMSKQERRECDARLSIRTALSNIPDLRKLEVLESLLAEEAFQIWGRRDSFEIAVRPRASRITIDGRKVLHTKTIEVTAA